MTDCKCGCGETVSGYNYTLKKPHEYKKGHCNRNENHAMWKGEGVGYAGIHAWLKRHMPKPEKCELCNIMPPYDLSNKAGIFNRNPGNWWYLCRGCHIKYDGTLINTHGVKSDAFKRQVSVKLKGRVPWNKK